MTLAISLLVLGLLGSGLLIAFQNRMIYFPNRYGFGDAIHPDLPPATLRRILGPKVRIHPYRATDGRELLGMLIPPKPAPGDSDASSPSEAAASEAAPSEAASASSSPDAPRPRFYLVFYGNASNALGMADWCEALHERTGAGFFIPDYRGYGFNEGRPSEAGLTADALGAYDTLEAEGFFRDGVGLIGISLGGGAAFAVAESRPVEVIATLATFSSIDDVARYVVPWPIYKGLWNHWPNERRLRELAARPPEERPARVVLFHSTMDDVVPFALGEKLARAGEGYAEFVPVEATHMTIPDLALEGVAEVLRRGSDPAGTNSPLLEPSGSEE